MVSFQFLQGINTKSLAKYENGAYKPFKTGITITEHQTLTWVLSKRDFNIKREISRLQLNEKHCCGIKTENPINGCCSKSIQFTK